MKKILSVLSISLAFLAVSSCQDPDPATIYGWTAQGQNIPGPRILQKIEMGTLLFEDYTSTNGILSKMEQYVYDNTTLSEKHVFVPSYTSGKLTKMDATYTVVSTNQASTDKFIPAYSANRMTGYSRVTTYPVATMNQTGVFSYDTTGNVTKLVEKMYMGTATMPTTERTYNIFYSGNNISKVEKITKNMDPVNGSVINSLVETDEYTLYDNKLTPYSTLSKDYLLLMCAVNPSSFYTLSQNNLGKYKYSNPMLPAAVEQVNTFQYDQQNYATTNGSLRYFYKAK